MNRAARRWSRRVLFIAIPLSVMACRQTAGNATNHSQHVENGLLPAVTVHGQPAPAGMKLADRMAHYHVLGVSIAVIDDGKLEWAKGYGVIEARGAKAVTTETLFQAASISKPLTALAALALVQNRKLNLDENVNVKLTSWKVPDNQFTKEQKVTLRRLLNHTAGLNVEDVGSYATGEALPTLVEALDGLKPAHSDPIRVRTIPGSSFRYSGGGYSVVQQLLMDVTGKPFPELMEELVIDPIGMTSSTFRQPLPTDLNQLPQLDIRSAALHLTGVGTRFRKRRRQVCGQRHRTSRGLPLRSSVRTEVNRMRCCRRR